MFTNNSSLLSFTGICKDRPTNLATSRPCWKTFKTPKKNMKKKETDWLHAIGQGTRTGETNSIGRLRHPLPPFSSSHTAVAERTRLRVGWEKAIEKKEKKRIEAHWGNRKKEQGEKEEGGWWWFPTIRTKLVASHQQLTQTWAFFVYLKHSKGKGAGGREGGSVRRCPTTHISE